ncbi:unnamed protein product [Cuscuta epithymum]|uniref:F-box/LRR-repeat protein 15/At3g58940/PEG3-like LRR domain-containing protein n=1 Tax=Cuscuta epithymum TaxID=186058 RepID=A0AAV0GLA8_9ASTE|nr:unnamed protein product [Cuscuta epithymum]
MITNILLLHSGPVREFSLYICSQEDPALPQSDIDSWCLFLSRNGIEDLTLGYFEFQYYDLPVCIVSCPTIKILSLRNFFFRFPVNAPPGGIFPNLTFVFFSRTDFEHNAAGIMGCRIPNLVELVFSHCNEVQKCVINAPKLESLMVIGSTMYRNEWSEWRWFLIHLPIIKTLCLSVELFVDNLGATINIQEMLPIAINVEVIKLYEFNFASAKHFDFAVQLIKKCPKLCELEILAEQFSSMEEFKAAARAWEDPEYGFIDQELAVIKTVKFASFLGLRLEVQFVKTILSNSPALETLVIQEASYNSLNNSVVPGIVRKMPRFPRASPKAQIVLLNYTYPSLVDSPPEF